jgi:hypothetical protein
LSPPTASPRRHEGHEGHEETNEIAIVRHTNKQQTTNNKQQTTNSKQQTANNKQQTTNSKQETTGEKSDRDKNIAVLRDLRDLRAFVVK